MSLFDANDLDPQRVELSPGAVLLRQFTAADASVVIDEVLLVAQQSPWRHMKTRGGFEMSVAMTNCGDLGWTSDHSGYKYRTVDPVSGQPWPAMSLALRTLATRAATEAGYPDFAPDSCLINRYAIGARMALHQDRNEPNLVVPIVSFSFGVPATFLWGGLERSDKTTKVELRNGDAVVWGGPARMTFHGIAPLKAATHQLTGDVRYNLTFRQAEH